MRLITLTNSSGSRHCDARCHTGSEKRCRCICGGKLHGIALRGDDLVRLTLDDIEAIAERLEPFGVVTYNDPNGKWLTRPLFTRPITPPQ